MDGKRKDIISAVPDYVADDVNPFAEVAAPVTRRVKQIWAIGGGKGGVGKSLICSSLAISLARTGAHVVTIDLDLGGANLHTTLGVDLPRKTLSDFFSGRVPRLDECVTPTGIPNLGIISGAQDSMSVAGIQSPAKTRLLQQCFEMDADYLIFDLGAGTGLNTLDFFLFADIQMLAALPEPTSIENVYRFIKSAYFRRLLISPNLHEIRPLIETAMDSKNTMGIRSPSDLFREVNRSNPEAGMRLKQEISTLR